MNLDALALLIGLGGLLLAFFTTYLAYLSRKEERTASYRRALYEKQVDTCIKIIDLVAKQLSNISEIRRCKNKDLIRQPINEARKTNHDFLELYRRSLVLLPTETNEALQSFGKAASNAIHVLDPFQEPINGTEKEKARQELQLKHDLLLLAVRTVIGTDPLSKETLKMIGIDQES